MITRIGNVQQEEKKIKFGGCPRAWKEVEADEATFDKKTLTPEEDMHDDGKPVLWEQWGAIVQRGNPQALVLTKLNPAMTVPRAPGPRAIRKADWKPLACRLLMNRNVILHTDSARSNRMKLPGVVHDAVVHKERKVKKNNKWVWLKPMSEFLGISSPTVARSPAKQEPKSLTEHGSLSRNGCAGISM